MEWQVHRPTAPTPSSTTMLAVSTSPGGLSAGLMPTANAPLAKSRFNALSSPFSLYAYSDHLPLKWVRKCDKGPVSAFTLEQLSDFSWVHTCIPGPQNTLYDGLSRYPFLAPAFSTTYTTHSVTHPRSVPSLLHIPNASPNKYKPGTAPPTRSTPTLSPTAHPLLPTRLSLLPFPHPKTPHGLPPAYYSPLSRSPSCYLPPELAPRIADADHFPDQPELIHMYTQGGKIMFLDSDHLWFLGNLPTLQQFSKIYAQLLCRPSPLLEHFASTRDATLPFLTSIPPDLQHHADLQHLSHPKVFTSLARHYDWPNMKKDVRSFLQNCELCENERTKRRLAHAIFSGHHTDKPRSRPIRDGFSRPRQGDYR
jgi:hypothetical protein